MKLSPPQQKVIDALESSPLAWVGHKKHGFGNCIILENRLLIGQDVGTTTLDALVSKKLVVHAPLVEEQRDEYARRAKEQNFPKRYLNPPTWGFILATRALPKSKHLEEMQKKIDEQQAAIPSEQEFRQSVLDRLNDIEMRLDSLERVDPYNRSDPSYH
jgi:hypothetical protein